MTDLDNVCEYFIWWPNKQVCPNWTLSGRRMFDDDNKNNKIFIRLCPEHLTGIQGRTKPDKLKYYRVTKYTVDQNMDGTGEIVKEGYDHRGDGYVREFLSVGRNEKER